MAHVPSFLYRNRCGIFCFQKRIPEALRVSNPALPITFRISLSTRDKVTAVKKARRMSVIFDDLAQQYFKTPEGFATALKLLQQYKEAERSYPSFEVFQSEFLDDLDDVTGRESEILKRAFSYLEARSLSCGIPAQPLANASTATEDDLYVVIQRAMRDQVRSNLIPIQIDDAFEKFIASKGVNWKENGDSALVYRNDIFPIFAEIIGKIETSQLAPEHVNRYKELILKLPKNRSKVKRYKGLAVASLLEMEVPTGDQLSKTSKAKYLDRLAAFLEWLHENSYAVAGLSSSIKGVVKSEDRPHEQRNQYAGSDLRSLFNSKAYCEGLHNEAFKYWVPLIGLLSGARLNEICQLYLKDVYKHPETNIWVFDLNEHDSVATKKSLKRTHHARLVPIHPVLLNLGFLKYVDRLRSQDKQRLFEELPYRSEKNKYGEKAQKWFNNTYTNASNCNIQTPKTSFHSLRHTFINCLATAGVDPNRFAFLVGQSAVGGVTSTRYMKPAELKVFQQFVQKVDYKKSIDFDRILPWEQQRFGRAMMLSVKRLKVARKLIDQ